MIHAVYLTRKHDVYVDGVGSVDSIWRARPGRFRRRTLATVSARRTFHGYEIRQRPAFYPPRLRKNNIFVAEQPPVRAFSNAAFNTRRWSSSVLKFKGIY